MSGPAAGLGRMVRPAADHAGQRGLDRRGPGPPARHQVGTPGLGRDRDHLHGPGAVPRSSAMPCSCAGCRAAAAWCRSPRTRSCTTSAPGLARHPAGAVRWALSADPAGQEPGAAVRSPGRARTTRPAGRPACNPRTSPLLAELARDGRASHAALAAAIHWHESTVRRRIEELRRGRPAALRGRPGQPGARHGPQRHALALGGAVPARRGRPRPGRRIPRSRSPPPPPGRPTWSPARCSATPSTCTST